MSVPVSVTAYIFTRLGMKTKPPWRALREGIVICVMCAECSAPSDSRYHTCVGDVGVLQVGRMLAWFHHFIRWEGFLFCTLNTSKSFCPLMSSTHEMCFKLA